jgi:hypothetical protein
LPLAIVDNINRLYMESGDGVHEMDDRKSAVVRKDEEP